jgi:transcriptional regulator with XRE-family HTH domain
MTTFGTRLKNERTRIEKTQTELAAIGAVKKNAQSLYERDANSPDAAYLERIAVAGVDIHYLFYGVYSDTVAKLHFNDILTALHKLSPEQQAIGFGMLSMLGNQTAGEPSNAQAAVTWRAVRLYNQFLTMDDKEQQLVEAAAQIMQSRPPDSAVPPD